MNLFRPYTAQKIKFSIKDFFSKSEQIRSFLQIWSHLLKKSLMRTFIFLYSVIQGMRREMEVRSKTVGENNFRLNFSYFKKFCHFFLTEIWVWEISPKYFWF